MSAALVHGGLPRGVRRVDLLALIEDLGKRGLGLSSTAVRVLRHYVWRSRDEDYLAGRICAVWDRVCRTAEELDLCSRAINDAERELEAKGLLVRTTGGNGARSGVRSSGVIRWAAGINLAPLIERYDELKALREARDLQQQAVAECKADIRRVRRLIRDAAEPVLLARADEILPDGRMAPIHSIERLEAIRAALEAVLAELDVEPRATNASDGPEENDRPKIQTHHLSESCSGRSATPSITTSLALQLASEEFRELAIAQGHTGWMGLVEAARQSASWLGISQRTWGNACALLGRERAAMCVLVIERNARLHAGHRYHARHPGKCFNGMVRRAARGGFNLDGMLRAIQRGEGASPCVEQPPTLPGRNEGMAALSEHILSRISAAMGDPA